MALQKDAILECLKELQELKSKQIEKREKQRVANRNYLHKKRAAALGVSIKEYQDKYARVGRPREVPVEIDITKYQVEPVEVEDMNSSEEDTPVEPVKVVLPKRKGRPRKEKS